MDINIIKLKEYASKCSVLYVEDDELIRTQTANFLGRFFPDIVLAEDGLLGLERYSEREFDIVITDINMPNLNGIEMTEEIKKINYDQIILITSAHNDSEYLMKLINLHVMRFILKPFNNKQFLYILYKIVEELTNQKDAQKRKKKINLLLKNSQIIVDEIKVGIVVIKQNKIKMVNRAFLKIGGFDSFETLALEMPQIAVQFDSINATTNEEFIKELQSKNESEKNVKIEIDGKMYEYQVTVSKLEEKNSFLLTFSDITAFYNSLYLDEHTKLPKREFIFEKIEILKQSVSSLDTILVSLKNFENIEKWYGKVKAIDVEIEFANEIKKRVKKYMPNSFVGQFSQNQIIIFPNSNETQEVKKALRDINISIINESKQNMQVDLHLNTATKSLKLDANKELHELEVDLVSAYEVM